MYFNSIQIRGDTLFSMLQISNVIAYWFTGLQYAYISTDIFPNVSVHFWSKCTAS